MIDGKDPNMDRAEAIAVKWARQSMGDTMDLAAEIRLAIVEAEQAAAAARDMLRILVYHKYRFNSDGGMCSCGWVPNDWKTAWEEWAKHIPLPTQALDLLLAWSRLEEHGIYCTKDVSVPYERGTLPCSPGQSHETGYLYYLCSKEHPCPRRKELDAKVSALEQAQREGND